ncbi:MAG: tyrosine-type recombinase/integrase [Lachnospiraceae bacterium]|nr:tyrosine-type recombinase/integrase [Lachnospiraceae bacterium]
MRIHDSIELYLADKAVYCAPDSVRYYREALSLFLFWCSKEGYLQVEQLQVDVLKSYAAYLRNTRQIKATSIHTNFRAVNNYIQFLIEQGFLQKFNYKIKLPKPDPALVMPLSSSEVQQIIRCIASRNVNNIRDMLLFRLMLDCGLRSSEARKLTLPDLDMEKKLIKIVDSKFSKSRLLPMPEVIHILARLYLSDAGSCRKYVFQDAAGSPMNANALKQFFAKLKKRSGVPRVHAHLLRHTFATSYMISHSNIEYLRLYLGHEDYDVTKGYIHLASQCLLTHYDCYRIDGCFV